MMRSRVAWLVLLAAVSGCAGSTAAQSAAPLPHVTPTAAPVSIRIVLPSRTMITGSQMSGRVVVNNATGHAIHVESCGSPFVVALSSSTYRPTVAFATCLHVFTIRAGRSSYPVQVLATYLACSQSAPPRCLRGKHKGQLLMPPLPPGRYRAELFLAGDKIAPLPPPIPVRVTPK